MLTTPNYKLNEPESNDTVNLVTLVKTNMDIIDSQMKSNADAATTAQTTANAAVPSTDVGVTVASLDATGQVPASQLGNAPAPADATTTTPGLVEVSAPPASGSPVAVTTTDPVYENAARKDQVNTWGQTQTFNATMQVNQIESTSGGRVLLYNGSSYVDPLKYQ